MNQQQWLNLLLFIGIVLALYFFMFRNNQPYLIEGMENENKPTENGIASNSDTYMATIKDLTAKLKDEMNISNSDYRKKYEKIILEVDNLLSYLMLKSVLTIDKTKPEISLVKLAQMNDARAALNNVLKFVDKQP